MSDTQRILDELARTGIDLLLREPFYAHVFGRLNKEVVGRGHPVDTLAVGLGQNALTLYVNGQQVDSVSDDTFTSGYVGLFVWSGEETDSTYVTFDDFVITSIK